MECPVRLWSVPSGCGVSISPMPAWPVGQIVFFGNGPPDVRPDRMEPEIKHMSALMLVDFATHPTIRVPPEY